MTDNKLKRNLLIFSFSAAAFALPLSVWLLSFFTILLFAIWLWDRGISRLYMLTGAKRTVLFFLGIWLVYLIWMINTADFSYGLKELRLKLPLVVFPIVAGLSAPLSNKELKIIISFFVTGVVISSAAGVIIEWKQVLSGISDSRELSPFISHIRLALMAVFASACSASYFYVSEHKLGWDLLFPAVALWLTIYIFLLLSLTGIILLALIVVLTLMFIVFKKSSLKVKATSVILLTILAGLTILYLHHEVKSYYNPGGFYETPLKQFTSGANPYWHDTLREDIENGNKVWIYICEEEIRECWDMKSSIPYDSLDRKGQTLKYTLIRYMTSAGLKKDSAGFSSLSEQDIRNVEEGTTNILFKHWPRLKSKIYEIIWQVDYYRNGGNPSGHSLTQRIEFLKTGWNVFLRMPLFGAGTGDLAGEFIAQYDIDRSKLDQNHRLISHNQYLDFLASFGITGFIIICFSIFYPVIKSGRYKLYLPLVFLLIILLSMFWEDTLETHTGVSYFAYFYSVFIFSNSGYEKQKGK